MLVKEDRILKRVLYKFCEDGLSQSSIESIALGVGLPNDLQFKLYNNQAEFVANIYKGLIGLVEANLRETLENAEDPVKEFLSICNRTLAYFRFNTPTVLADLKRDHVKVYEELSEFSTQFLPAVFSYNIERGIKRGMFKGCLNSDIAAQFLLSQLQAICHDVQVLKMYHPVQNIRKQLLTQILYGIATEDGGALADQYFFTSPLQYKS